MSRFNEKTFENWSQWVVLAQGGDKGTYARFLNECSSFLISVVTQKVGFIPEKDDIVQECLIGIHKSLATYDPSRPIKPWILTIAKFKIYDYFRKLEKKSKEISENETSDVTNEQTPENLIIEREGLEQWEALLSKLPENLKTAIVLTKVEGLSYKEAAQKEGITEASLRKRISRAYSAISESLKTMETSHVE